MSRFQQVDGATTLQEKPRRPPPPRWGFPLFVIVTGSIVLAVVLAVLRGAA